MSHVSENALFSFDEAQNLRFDFADEHDLKAFNSAELNAYYIIGSSAFDELLHKAADTCGGAELLPNMQEFMKRAIVGLPVSDDVPLMHELISGPFGCGQAGLYDRDAQMCGVPVVTDIPRLVQKVRAIKTAEPDLPPEIGAKIAGGKLFYWLTGVAISGGRTLDELMLGGALLFAKIYRHQKVRAIEAMVRSIFELVGVAVTPDPAFLR